MQKTSSIGFAVLPLFALALGCAHSAPVSLTSASAAVPAPVAAAPVVEAPAAPVEEAKAETPAAAPPPSKVQKTETSFAELSAQLGGDQKMRLDIDSTPNAAPAPKAGLNASSHDSVGALRQATPENGRYSGDVKVTGGLGVGAVRGTVRESNQRLRVCYERGLANAPRLAGHVTVSFSVDEHGAVSEVEAESATLPAEVTSCVRDVFSSMTFQAPKAPPAKVVYPIEFTKDS